MAKEFNGDVPNDESLPQNEEQNALPSEIDIMQLWGRDKEDILQALREKVSETLHPEELVALIHPFFNDPNESNTQSILAQRWYEDLDAAIEREDVDRITELYRTGPHRFKDKTLNGSYLRYYRKLRAFLRNNSRDMLLLGEVKQKRERSINILRVLGFTGTILFYETEKSNARPFYSAQSVGGYNQIARVLFEVGIRRLVVGGQNIWWNQRNFSQLPEFQERVHGAPVVISDDVLRLESHENGFSGCVYGFILNVGLEMYRMARYFISGELAAI
jgi:hypothetical protein